MLYNRSNTINKRHKRQLHNMETNDCRLSMKTMHKEKRTNLILAFDGVTLSDIIGPAEIFEVANRFALENQSHHYETVIATSKGAPIKSWSGLVLNAVDLDEIDPETIDTILVPGGSPPTDPPIPAAIVDFLKKNGHHARRICAICTGTFILAESGLTQGHNVTTHWQAADTFSERYPNTNLDVDSVFLKDQSIWSSAGFTAGLDMALALIQEDEGYETAIGLARMLVMFLKRTEGQSQFSAPLSSQLKGGEDFSDLHQWVSNNLTRRLTVEELAKKSNMTPRTFARKYRSKLGYTPAKMVDRFRLDAACEMLNQTDYSLKVISVKTGYSDEQNMRRSFDRLLGLGPREYRKRFSKRN